MRKINNYEFVLNNEVVTKKQAIKELAESVLADFFEVNEFFGGTFANYEKAKKVVEKHIREARINGKSTQHIWIGNPNTSFQVILRGNK